MTKTQTRSRPRPRADLLVAVTDAHAAADAAARLAEDAADWAARSEVGMDDAVEAIQGAMRARMAAAQAERCTDPSEAWSCSRLAWAAMTSAREASERLNAAIAESLVAA